MSISPTVALAAMPAIRIASETAKAAISTGVGFARYLVASADRKSGEDDSKAVDESRPAGFDPLLPKLQDFLKSIGVQERSTIELKTDGQQPIEVDGDPSLKQAVKNWLDQNPDWTASWRAAVGQYLAESPIGSSSKDTRRWAASTPPSLRSQISSATIEHWRSI